MRIPGLLTKHNEFIRHVATMMSGKTIAGGIALATMPIIARLFDPSDFGVAAVFMSILGIASNISSFRYESAIVLPKTEDEVLSLMAFTYRVLVVFCLVTFAIIGILELSHVNWAMLDLLGRWKWLLPIAILLSGALTIQENWLTRKKAFNVISASMVSGNLASGGSRIAFGWFAGTSVYGLIIGNLLGLTCRLLVQKTASMEGLRATFSRIGWPVMREIAHRYKDFPILTAPAGFIYAFGQRLPVVLFGVMFSPAAAGLYTMASRLSRVPVTIVANSMRGVFYRKAAKIENSGRSLRNAFLLATGGLVLLGILPFTCMWWFGQPFSVWLLGEPWRDAGRYLEIIAPWMFMIWVLAPSNPVFMVLRKQGFWLFLQTALTFGRLGAFGLAYFIEAGPEWTLKAFVAVTVAGNLITIMIAMILISRHAANRSSRAIPDS